MQGNFIFSTCNQAGLKVRAFLKNSARNSTSFDNKRLLDVCVSLKIFHDGILLDHMPDAFIIPEGGRVEISEDNCPLLAESNSELLLIAHCRRGEDDNYFPQEHQVVFGKRHQEVRTTSLVYDQMPVIGPQAHPKPILLLGPKVWVSNDVNTFITFAAVDDRCEAQITTSRWELTFLRNNGETIKSFAIDILQNSSYVLDVKSVLDGHLKLTNELQMMTVVARGDGISCVILTLIHNKKTDALALEHSLSPHYYMTGDFSRVRKEAFLFPNERNLKL